MQTEHERRPNNTFYYVCKTFVDPAIRITVFHVIVVVLITQNTETNSLHISQRINGSGVGF